MSTPADSLDIRERHFRIPGPVDGLQLFLRLLPSTRPSATPRAVLFVHGMSFPSALSVAHRFDGRSWRDELCDAGFHVWALDFYGFGGSDRYPEMHRPADENPPLGLAEEASRQVESAVRFICREHGPSKLSLVAHSAGTIAAGRFAARHGELIERMVFFAPIARRGPFLAERSAPLAAWRVVSVPEQWERFTKDVPSGQPPVLSEAHFRTWAESFLDSDSASRRRTPPGVQVPNGMAAEIAAAWQGRLAYDPAEVHVPVAIVRGEWDTLCADADARWLFDALAAPVKRDVKISRATHLMHLEECRHALHRESVTFLQGT